MTTKITLTWAQCKLIAAYYRFPETVFLLSETAMKKELIGVRKRIKKLRPDKDEG